MDGNDLRCLPLSMRKANLQRLLSRRPDGIFVSDFEQGEIGPDLFRKACELGLEGLVPKRAYRPYRGGRSKEGTIRMDTEPGAFKEFIVTLPAQQGR
jgi:bifunctional non-homologous end joining protein LigD